MRKFSLSSVEKMFFMNLNLNQGVKKKTIFSTFFTNLKQNFSSFSISNEKSVLKTSSNGASVPRFLNSKLLDLFVNGARYISTSDPRLKKVITFRLADIGEGIAEVHLLEWYKKENDEVIEMDQVCKVSSDKAAVEITSRYTGKIVKIHHNKNDVVKIGEPLMDIELEGDHDDDHHDSHEGSHESETKKEEKNPSNFDQMRGEQKKKEILVLPAARRLAKELGIDLADVQGTGRDGRISKEDVENHQSKKVSASKTIPPVQEPSSEKPTTTKNIPPNRQTGGRKDVEVELRGFPRVMFKSMTESLSVPHLNIGDEYDVTKLMTIRNSLKDLAYNKFGVKLTVTPIIIKAVSVALDKHPIINSKVDPHGNKYTMFGDHNISIAIDSPHGLVVPNIKKVQDLSIIQIQAELLRLQHLAQSNCLSRQELVGGTFSISNVGVISGTYVKAILFDGQACIMGIGQTKKVPKFDSAGNVVARQVLNCAYSADHRHCDGATVARFNLEVKNLLENPDRMLLEML